MSAMSIRLSHSLHQRLREYAEKEGVSINQFIASAALEKMSALSTEQYLEGRATRASREKFEAALNRVPDVDPDPMEN